MKGYLRLVAGAVGVLLLAGCVARPTTAARDATLDSSFGETLRACRFLRGGRPGMERRQPARDERLRGCLARRGWHADGTPTLAQLLGPQGAAGAAAPSALPVGAGAGMPSASATKAH
jgi:hypothetical protein